MLKLSSPVTDISGIGPARAKALQKLNITHARNFLYTFPRRYDDFSSITPFSKLKPGEQATVRGKITSVTSSYGYYGRRRVLRIFVDIEDETGTLSVTWYNLKFLVNKLHEGQEILVAGKVDENMKMRSPVIEWPSSDPTHTARITPVYPETHGVSSRWLRFQVKNLIPLLSQIPDYLPENIREQHNLIGIHEAITQVHFPDSTRKLSQAQARLKFDELFFLQLAALVRRAERKEVPAKPVNIAPEKLSKFTNNLPFKLTSAQKNSIDEIIADISKESPMNRLLQGDVGSGKSIVAASATYATLESGMNALYLAPTEVLARQQHKNFQELFEDQAELLIGAMKTGERRRVLQRLHSPKPTLVIGTHALLQDSISAEDIGLVIVDEQHRFGVSQRQSLQRRNSSSAFLPHLLSMTATPIPRTLSLTVYGDLDVSVIDQLPAGRKEIKTEIIPPTKRDQAITHILEELHQGRQAYVIAPLVSESGKLQAKSAEECFAEMQEYFPDISVGMLHGQMNSEDKASALNNFSAGTIQLLVATAAVEVGVNVPNATIMIIEGAERFGLAQLHQFRGRIGRGKQQSYCYLFPTTQKDISERLKILSRTTDGFKIAEADLELRGPGEIYGVAQSGFGNLRVASLLDYAMLKKARTSADELLQQDPKLAQHNILQKKVIQKNLTTHFE